MFEELVAGAGLGMAGWRPGRADEALAERLLGFGSGFVQDGASASVWACVWLERGCMLGSGGTMRRQHDGHGPYMMSCDASGQEHGASCDSALGPTGYSEGRWMR